MTDYAAHIDRATESLRQALDELDNHIREYPTPISGCDTQFNHLLAERTKVESALRDLDTSVFIPTPRKLNPGDSIESR